MGSHLRRKAWVARGAEETAGGATVLLPRGWREEEVKSLGISQGILY